MKKLLITSIIALIATASYSQPRNLQAKVIEIIKQDKKRVECKALSMQGDTVVIRYGFSGWRGNAEKIKPGTWLTIQSDYSDRYREWYCKRIFINH